MSGEVIILEEAAYCDKGLIDEVVVPLLSMRSSVLLCISTLLDTGNHYSKMMSLVDDFGNSVFKNISITLVCGANTFFQKLVKRVQTSFSPNSTPALCADECLKTDFPEKCRHKIASMPRWLSSAKVEVVRQLLAEDPGMMLRETLGISADGTEKAFHIREIEAFMERNAPDITFDRRRPEEQTRHVFVACDPSGGGVSAFSIASVCVDFRGFIHVRNAPFFLCPHTYASLFTTHIQKKAPSRRVTRPSPRPAAHARALPTWR